MSACRICERTYDGTQHLGIEACRACTAFFRRAVERKKNLVCRRGNNKCNLNTSRKDSCQLCRFNKCLLVGLNPEDLAKKVGKSRIVDSQVSSTVATDDPSSSSSVPSLLVTKQSNSRPILSNLLKNYKKYYEQRVSSEREKFKSKYQEELITSSGESFGLIHKDVFAKLIESQVDTIYEFIIDSFPVIRKMSEATRTKLFHDFLLPFSNIESFYLSGKMSFNEQDRDRRIQLISPTTCFDQSRMYKFYNDDDSLSTADRTQIEEILEVMVQQMNYTADLYVHLKLSETEFVSLLALLLWSQKADTPEMFGMMEQERSKIYGELHNYYIYDMRMSNYAARICEVTQLITEVRLYNAKIRDDTHLLKLFNFFKDANFLLQFLSSKGS